MRQCIRECGMPDFCELRPVTFAIVRRVSCAIHAPSSSVRLRKDIDHPFIMTQVNTFETKKSVHSSEGIQGPKKATQWTWWSLYISQNRHFEVYILTELITGGELHGTLVRKISCHSGDFCLHVESLNVTMSPSKC